LALAISGLLVGMIFGAIPGLSVVMAVILLLPFSYGLSVTQGLILLAGAYYGGVFGGSISAILLRIPGDSIHVPLLWESRGLVQKGMGARAVGSALYGATVGGFAGLLVLTFLGPLIAHVALQFRSPEYFAVVFFGLTTVVALGNVGATRKKGSLRSAVISLLLGVFFGTVGIDGTFAVPRFTFGIGFLNGGIGFTVLLIGVYAIGEVILRFTSSFQGSGFSSHERVKPPTFKEMKQLWPSLGRGTLIGSVIGMIPAAGATVAAFISYGIERQVSKAGKLLGTGRLEGVVAPQTAASATVGGALTPLLTLGIPGSATDAVILGAFLLKGIQPGPGLFTQQHDLVYAIIGALFLCVAFLVIATFFLTPLFMKALAAPQPIVLGIVMVFAVVGAYALQNNFNDVILALVFGVVGYLMRIYDYPIAPLVLGIILGPIAERTFLTSVIATHNFFIFFEEPIALAFMVISALALTMPIWQAAGARYRRRREGGRSKTATSEDAPTGSVE
ncbi:MAG: tripartite tricarboxylate transporter permease, partial [Bryobacteraceae bacterium]